MKSRSRDRLAAKGLLFPFTFRLSIYLCSKKFIIQIEKLIDVKDTILLDITKFFTLSNLILAS